MKNSMVKITLIALIGALVAPLGDYGHVVSRATEYLWYPELRILKSPWWFVLLVGTFAGGLALVLDQVRRRFPAMIAPGCEENLFVKATGATGAVMFVYLVTALLPGRLLALEVICLAALSLFIWSILDGTLVGFMTGCAAAVIGVFSESLLVALGLYSYNAALGVFFGVAPWLFAIFFLFGVCIVRLEAWLEGCLAK